MHRFYFYLTKIKFISIILYIYLIFPIISIFVLMGREFPVFLIIVALLFIWWLSIKILICCLAKRALKSVRKEKLKSFFADFKEKVRRNDVVTFHDFLFVKDSFTSLLIRYGDISKIEAKLRDKNDKKKRYTTDRQYDFVVYIKHCFFFYLKTGTGLGKKINSDNIMETLDFIKSKNPNIRISIEKAMLYEKKKKKWFSKW